MRNLQFFSATIFSTCLLYACSGAGAASVAKDSVSASTTGSKGDSVYYGKNSLAYSINGRRVAIKDDLKQGEGKYLMALFLNKVENNAVEGTVKINLTNELSKEVFNFLITNKGTTTVLNWKPSLAYALKNKTGEATYMGSNYTNYYGQSVTIAITAIDDKHVAGTFSGKFSTEDNALPPAEIKDGSFDVLFTKDEK